MSVFRRTEKDAAPEKREIPGLSEFSLPMRQRMTALFEKGKSDQASDLISQIRKVLQCGERPFLNRPFHRRRV